MIHTASDAVLEANKDVGALGIDLGVPRLELREGNAKFAFNRGAGIARDYGVVLSAPGRSVPTVSVSNL